MIKLMKYGEVPNTEIFARMQPKMNVEQIVSDIIENVKQNGDKAVKEYCLKFDKADLSSLLVSAEEMAEAKALVEPEFYEILKKASVI